MSTTPEPLSRRIVVTGAFGYSGRYITRRLLDAGARVTTLTNSPRRANPFGDRVSVSPYYFDDPPRLVEALRGADALINTYWVRFNHADFTHETAVRNAGILFRAAADAGVRRVVHVSITNPSENSPDSYFRGKARMERALRETGLSHAVLRPAVLFGPQDILINNIAWLLRRFPVFGLFGRGRYRLQPIFVDDLAKLAVEQASSRENVVIDAIGPETFTFRELVHMLAGAIGVRRLILPCPPTIACWIGRAVGAWMNDVFVTRDEIDSLMADGLYVNSPPAGTTRLSEWARANAATLGIRYANELARRRDRETAYERI